MGQLTPENEEVDPRNKLNCLSNKRWMLETKSVWFSVPGPRDSLKAQHPATFAETDITRLVEFFTKPGQTVLDPFLGSGSTLVACARTGRRGTGIELVKRWADTSIKRLAAEDGGDKQVVLHGDCREVLPGLPENHFDFIVTSPPYWSILRKDWDKKVKAERKARGLSTRYSDDDRDLGNLTSYERFLCELGRVFELCRKVLKPRRYMCVVVSDFRHKSRFVAYHSDISEAIAPAGFSLEGITILVQDSKNLYPYGVPFAFVSNIHHQDILVFRRTD